MSAIDLTEAVKAAARGAYEAAPGDGPAWEDLPAIYRHEVEEIALGFITHAAPVIAAAIGALVVQEIEAEAGKRRREADETAAARRGKRDPHQDSIRAGLTLAARIARGGAA